MLQNKRYTDWKNIGFIFCSNFNHVLSATSKLIESSFHKQIFSDLFFLKNENIKYFLQHVPDCPFSIYLIIKRVESRGIMARFDYLASYVTFESVQEMDEQVELHIRKNFYDLTESDKEVLYKIASHSLDYPGACHLKAQTIGEALEISVRTVFRSLKHLEELQIIQRIQTKKMNGIKGANIFSILPCHDTSSVSHQEKAEIPCERKEEPAQIEEEPSFSFNPKHHYVKHTYPILNSSLRNRIYLHLSSTTGNTSETKRFLDVIQKQLNPLLEWDVWKSHKKQLEDISFMTFKEIIQKTKRISIQNPFGYMYDRLKRKLDTFMMEMIEEYAEEARNSGISPEGLF